MNNLNSIFIKIITIVSFVFISNLCVAQKHICYHLGIDKAKQLIEQNQYTEAVKIHRSIWDVIEIKSYRLLLQRAKCHYLLNQFEKGDSFISEAVAYGSTLKEMKEFGIDAILHKTRWDDLLLLYETERKKHLFNFDFELYNQVQQMYHNDVYVRSHRFYGNDSIKYSIRNEVDSINFEKFKNLIDEHGYPTTKQIGIEGFLNLGLVVLHLGGIQSNEKWNFLNEILLNELRRGNLSPIKYSNLVDRRNFSPPGKGGIYGTILMSGSIIPVENIENLDSIRRTIGLYSLKRQAELMTRLKVFPEGYEPDELSIETLLELCE